MSAPKRIEYCGTVYEVLEVAYDQTRGFVALVRPADVVTSNFRTITLDFCHEVEVPEMPRPTPTSIPGPGVPL